MTKTQKQIGQAVSEVYHFEKTAQFRAAEQQAEQALHAETIYWGAIQTEVARHIPEYAKLLHQKRLLEWQAKMTQYDKLEKEQEQLANKLNDFTVPFAYFDTAHYGGIDEAAMDAQAAVLRAAYAAIKAQRKALFAECFYRGEPTYQ